MPQPPANARGVDARDVRARLCPLGLNIPGQCKAEISLQMKKLVQMIIKKHLPRKKRRGLHKVGLRESVGALQGHVGVVGHQAGPLELALKEARCAVAQHPREVSVQLLKELGQPTHVGDAARHLVARMPAEQLGTHREHVALTAQKRRLRRRGLLFSHLGRLQ